MDVLYELIIMFVTSLFFTLLYYGIRNLGPDHLSQSIIWGAVSITCWFVTAGLYLINQPAVPTVSLLFMGMGLTMVAMIAFDIVASMQLKRDKEFTYGPQP